MKREQINKLGFKGQNIFWGIDVHLKEFAIPVRDWIVRYGKIVCRRIKYWVFSAIWTISIMEKGGGKSSFRVNITAYRQGLIADRLLPSRACFLLTP